MNLDAIRLFAIKHRTLVSFGAAFVAYSLCTLFYMGGAATSCTESLLSFPGDNTAGLIAMYSIDNHDPWFGFTNVYSYPYGEVLGQPTHITAQVLFVPFWALAKVFGPICGFNVLTMIGFMSAALTMFAFVRWLFGGKFFVALLAGFAVAFTPYLQTKTGVHMSYVFEAEFIAIIWLFMLFWKQPSIKRATLAGLALAICAYTDGYFILMGSVLAVALVLGALAHDYFKAGRKVSDELKQRIKYLCVAAIAAFVFMVPVAYIMYNSAGQINQSLTSTRDTISNEAQVYGARPLEYLLPNPLNPLLSKVFGDYKSRDNHGSNPAENLLSLSWVMMALAAYFVVRVYKDRAKKKALKAVSAKFDARFIAILFGTVFVIMLLVSLPPKLGPIPTPTYVVIHIVDLWRVFARLSVLANIALVVLASGGFILLLERIKSNPKRYALIAAAFVLIFVEYLTFTPPRPVGGYDKVPELYRWLHTQKAYSEIAEYPLDEFAASGNPVFYDTYQRIHGKKLLNGVISSDDAIFARLALRDLNRAQTVPGLRALGIDFITIHSPTNPGTFPGLTLRHVSNESILTTDGKPNKVWGYSVDPGAKAAYVVAPVAGFHAPIKDGPVHQTQEMGTDGVLSIRPLMKNVTKKETVAVTLDAQAVAKKGEAIRIVQGKTVLWTGTIPTVRTTISFAAKPQEDIHIIADKPTTDAVLMIPLLTVEE
jgi:hypothetical protein